MVPWASTVTPHDSSTLGRSQSPIFGEGLGSAPPTKSYRMVGFPEAAVKLLLGWPAQVEDVYIMGGQDEFAMAPKITVGLEGELEDLNVEPISMDRESDLSHPLSPT